MIDIPDAKYVIYFMLVHCEYVYCISLHYTQSRCVKVVPKFLFTYIFIVWKLFSYL